MEMTYFPPSVFHALLFNHFQGIQEVDSLQLLFMVSSKQAVLETTLDDWSWTRQLACATCVCKRNSPLLTQTLALSLFFSMHCFLPTLVLHRKLSFGIPTKFDQTRSNMLKKITFYICGHVRVFFLFVTVIVRSQLPVPGTTIVPGEV